LIIRAVELDRTSAVLYAPRWRCLRVNGLNGEWSVVTDSTSAQCGYVGPVARHDRAIVDSVPWGHNYGYDNVRFRLGR